MKIFSLKPDSHAHSKQSSIFKVSINKFLPISTKNIIPQNKSQLSQQNNLLPLFQSTIFQRSHKRNPILNKRSLSLPIKVLQNQPLKSKSSIDCLAASQIPNGNNPIVIDLQKEYDEDKELLDLLNQNISDNEAKSRLMLCKSTKKSELDLETQLRMNIDMNAKTNYIINLNKQNKEEHYNKLTVKKEFQTPIPYLKETKLKIKNERNRESVSSSEFTRDNTKKNNSNGYTSNEDCVLTHLNYWANTKTNQISINNIIPLKIKSRPFSNVNMTNHWALDKLPQTNDHEISREGWERTNYLNKLSSCNNNLNGNEVQHVKQFHKIRVEKGMLTSKWIDKLKMVFPSDFSNTIDSRHFSTNSSNWFDKTGGKTQTQSQWLKHINQGKNGWTKSINSRQKWNGPIKIINNAGDCLYNNY